MGEPPESKKKRFSLVSPVPPPVAMPTLPKCLVVVQAAMVSLLWNSLHSHSLYSADVIIHILIIVADVGGHSSTSTKVNTALLLRVFANDAEVKFVLMYGDHFCRRQDQNVLYVRKTTKPGRHGEKAVSFGCFLSIDAARRVDVVPWHFALDEQIRVRLAQILEEESAFRGWR